MNQIENFDKLCTQIFYFRGEFRFPFDKIHKDQKFNQITQSDGYQELKFKIKNLLILMNKDMTKINQETEVLWENI